ncbi:MAG: TRAP transporter small permease subunit [Proteobacteria bacterium]|nr:TRAP transporter small permease subunit [Pseudomonadota bacterium]
MIDTIVAWLDRAVAGVIALTSWLALPVVLLLFLQWPLRDLIHGYSRQANDLGQIFFALFVAVSVTAATRAGTHLAADTLAHRYSDQTRGRLRKIGAVVGLVPWALVILETSHGTIWQSLTGLEAFPDTGNPGYFLIKFALWLMTGIVLMQAVADILRRRPVETL